MDTARDNGRTFLKLLALLGALAMLLMRLGGGVATAQVAVTLSGHVTFADGTPAAGATVNANFDARCCVDFTAVTDAAGNYSLTLAPGTYSLDVAFSGPGFTGGTDVAPAFALAADAVRDLVLPTITLNGRVIDSAGNPVPNVQFRASAFSQGISGFDNINTTSGPDGRFQVRILPNSYRNIILTPPPDGFITTPLPDHTFST